MSPAQDEGGLVLTCQGRDVPRCRLTPNGMLGGGFVSRALGVSLPALGESAAVRVSTGALYRALGARRPDFSEEASCVVLARLPEEADMRRGAASLSE